MNALINYIEFSYTSVFFIVILVLLFQVICELFWFSAHFVVGEKYTIPWSSIFHKTIVFDKNKLEYKVGIFGKMPITKIYTRGGFQNIEEVPTISDYWVFMIVSLLFGIVTIILSPIIPLVLIFFGVLLFLKLIYILVTKRWKK